jgi:hypothetical protein
MMARPAGNSWFINGSFRVCFHEISLPGSIIMLMKKKHRWCYGSNSQGKRTMATKHTNSLDAYGRAVLRLVVNKVGADTVLVPTL